jgi:hypothetical protein
VNRPKAANLEKTMKQTKNSSPLEQAIVAIMVACCAQPALAGTKGAYMNSAGYGKAADSVVYAGKTNSIISAAMYYPSAAVHPTSSFTCNYVVGLPPGCPSTVYCQSKGAPNYLWSIQSYVTGGATADNDGIDSRVDITPAACAYYDIESSAVFTDEYSGMITVYANVTLGAAIWLRGFEYMGPGVPESLEDLISKGILKWDSLLTGPFNQSEGCGIQFAFTTLTGHTNLYFVVDAEAKSLPFDLTALAKSGEVQLFWAPNGADHYNIYRSTTSGGPYTKIGSTTSTFSTYDDTTVVNGTRYYYVVRTATAQDVEQCDSNEATAMPTQPRGRNAAVGNAVHSN